MIRVPECFQCKHYSHGKCPAYPDGIPAKVLGEEKKEKECSPGIRYTRKVTTSQ